MCLTFLTTDLGLILVRIQYINSLFHSCSKTIQVPKAYVAQGTRNSNPHPGSTILHMDLTSAVNVMVWTDNIDSKPGYAIWHIFAPEDADTLHKFLCDDLGINDVGDPIHAQCVCLTPSLLERLYSSYKICPHEIRQYHRDAIFIPAGCAHQVCMQALYRRGLQSNQRQVSNVTDSIKISLDLLDSDSLVRTLAVAQEFRAHRLATRYGEDVLQVFNVLWHTWCSLGQQAKNNPKPSVPGNSSIQLMPTAMRVHTSEFHRCTNAEGQHNSPSSTSTARQAKLLGPGAKCHRAK